jgi:hypothetical protein
MPRIDKVSPSDNEQGQKADTFLSNEQSKHLEATNAEAIRGTDTVLVGCKLATGLIMEVHNCPPKGRENQTLQPEPTGKQIILKGANSLRMDPRANQGVHPFAVTEVPRAHWEAWYEQHKDFEFVRAGLVFVADDRRSAEAIAKERIGQRTGLEGLNQGKDPRMPKSSNPNAVVQKDEAQPR